MSASATTIAASSWRGVIWLAKRAAGLSWRSKIAGTVLALLAAMPLAAPVISPHDPDSVNLSAAFQGFGPGNLLGTDGFGRDILSRLIWGARTSLAGPMLVVLFSTVAGTLVAVSAAWLGGRFDAIVGVILDIALAFPALLLAVLVVALLGPGFVAPVVALVIAYVPYVARLTRSAALRERSLPYISALTVQGFGGVSICLRHLVPNISPLILAQATIMFGYAIVDLAAISFLGLGVQPPQADWGNMIGTGGADILRGQPEVSLAAGMMIVITVIAVNVLGEGLAGRAVRR